MAGIGALRDGEPALSWHSLVPLSILGRDIKNPWWCHRPTLAGVNEAPQTDVCFVPVLTGSRVTLPDTEGHAILKNGGTSVMGG